MRATEPDKARLAALEAELEAGRNGTLQWHAPPGSAELHEANRLCAKYGALLEVRFYGWYGLGGHFDAAIVREVPEVRRLSVDCLTSVANSDALAELPCLENLHFGAHQQSDGAFLGKLALERFTRVSLAANRRKNFDLSPFGRCVAAERIFIEGHTRGIEALGDLPNLRELTLSGMPKTQPLDVVNRIPNLRHFGLILGSRASIAELAHSSLEKLAITWVRGLESVGDLGRFPALKELIVEDQLRIEEVDLSGAPLERVRFTNCKKLAQLHGMDRLSQLEWFHVSRTALDLDGLRDRDWPTTTRSIGLFSGSRAWNDATKDMFARRGISQFPGH
jgi:hypothetical protein